MHSTRPFRSTSDFARTAARGLGPLIVAAALALPSLAAEVQRAPASQVTPEIQRAPELQREVDPGPGLRREADPELMQIDPSVQQLFVIPTCAPGFTISPPFPNSNNDVKYTCTSQGAATCTAPLKLGNASVAPHSSSTPNEWSGGYSCNINDPLNNTPLSPPLTSVACAFGFNPHGQQSGYSFPAQFATEYGWYVCGTYPQLLTCTTPYVFDKPNSGTFQYQALTAAKKIQYWCSQTVTP